MPNRDLLPRHERRLRLLTALDQAKRATWSLRGTTLHKQAKDLEDAIVRLLQGTQAPPVQASTTQTPVVLPATLRATKR